MKRAKFVSLIIFVLLIVILAHPGFVFANPENWSEVARFEGSGTEHYNTHFFTCNYSEWRIRWEYVPIPPSNFSTFSVVTKPEGEIQPVSYIVQHENLTMNGVYPIHNRSGTFFCSIDVANLVSYSIVIEQDLDSVPELPYSVIVPVIIAAFSMSFIILIKREKWIAYRNNASICTSTANSGVTGK